MLARRREELLAQSLHEIRRPLQALALSQDPPADLAAALTALADLDRAITGREPELRRRPISMHDLVEGCVERWRRSVLLGGAALDLAWQGREAIVAADPVRVAQALDNMIDNAVEHGSPPLGVTGTVLARTVRVAVTDGGGADRTRADAGPVARRLRRVPRRPLARGQGLKLVRAIARAHGGRFVMRRSRSGTVAMLELPLAPPDAIAA